MSLTIRSIQSVDATVCGKIGYEAHRVISSMHGYPPEQPTEAFGIGLIERLVNNPHSSGFVAERDGTIVGSVFVHDFSSVAVIGPLTVHPSAEGGAGNALMLAALDKARELEKQRVRLVQSPSHLRSFALYTKCGFILREPLLLMQGGPRIGTSTTTTDGAVRKVNDDLDIRQCNELCESVYGFPRDMELEQAKDQGIAMMVERNGKISGYAAGIGLFGHAVARTNKDLELLIAVAPQISGPGFFVPARNHELLIWLLENGFRIGWPANLMSIGPYQEPAVPFLPSIAF